MAKYDLEGEKGCAQNYLINRFETIGFIDPYPKELNNRNKTIELEFTRLESGQETEVSDRVYPDSRYMKGNSPYTIYIPSKEIMLKLMRACIKVKKVEDLWIYNQNLEFAEDDP